MASLTGNNTLGTAVCGNADDLTHAQEEGRPDPFQLLIFGLPVCPWKCDKRSGGIGTR